MITEQNVTSQIFIPKTDRNVGSKKDKRDFANRHTDGKAFEWLMALKEIPHPELIHNAA